MWGGGGAGLFSERADPAHGHDKGVGFLQCRRSNPRENMWGFGLCDARDAEIQNCARW
jgi:hypothetical protein